MATLPKHCFANGPLLFRMFACQGSLRFLSSSSCFNVSALQHTNNVFTLKTKAVPIVDRALDSRLLILCCLANLPTCAV